MKKLHDYPLKVLEELSEIARWEEQFLQAVHEVFSSIGVVIDRNPQYRVEKILERMTRPERVISFKTQWLDDRNQVRVNQGYRVQFNNALGPYKGGLRFHASVDLDSLKFLAFEQTFKNALTGLPLGGGKGGADLAVRGLSDREIMRFCQGFMSNLYEYIGPDTDVPAGDIGVGGREIGFLFGQYKKMTHLYNGALTGKGINWGGSKLRPEATGYGVAYFANEILQHKNIDIKDKRVAVSGFGQVAWGVAKKVTELGAKVITLSGPDGFILDEEGVRNEKIDYMLEMRSSGEDRVELYADKFKVPFYAKKRPWDVKCDIAIPSAIQNELDVEDARRLIKNGCQYVVEGANMPTTAAALKLLQEANISFAPGKAANAGGVAVSGLEMSQNKSGLYWSEDEVDLELKKIMHRIHESCIDASNYYEIKENYVDGANIAAFTKVADAMLDQGVV